MSRKYTAYFRIGLVISLILSLITIILVSLAVGSVAISGQDFQGIIREGFENNFSSLSGPGTILWKIRLPRILMVGLIGAILSVLGLLMQTISRNPLADPYILGISSGASTGAVAAIVFGWLSFLGSYQIFYSSLLGSILITILLFLLMGGSQDPLKLILIGAGISAFFSALTTLIVFSAQNEAQVRSAMFWLVGSFSGVQWGDLPSVGISLLVLLCGSYLFQKELNLMYVGLKEAKQLGVNLKVFFISLILITSGAAAISVSKVGVIGFVGLIIPHIMRRLIGVDHRWLIGGSALMGANLLILADSFARTYFRPEEVPVGILTAFIGAPIFIHIVMGLYGGGEGE